MSKALQRTGPRLKSGGDAEAVEQIRLLFCEAQNAMRRVVALGIVCLEIKMFQVPSGQFKPWLAKHCPEVSYRSLAAYMQITKSVLVACGFKTLDGFFKKCSTLHFCHGGELLTLPEASLSKEAREIREGICHVVDGKSQRQLMFEFAQVDEDDEGNLTKHRGRTKGCKGTTKEQRQAARECEELERIQEIELASAGFRKWMEKHGDAKGVGLIGHGEFSKLATTVAWFHGVLHRLNTQRGGQA